MLLAEYAIPRGRVSSYGLVAQQVGAMELFRAAREEGLRTLKEAAIEKVFQGATTTTEMVRVTGK